jgi:hypothetical protein
MLDLITQVRNLALDAELKGRKDLARRLRAAADEAEAGQEMPSECRGLRPDGEEAAQDRAG